MSYKTLFTLRNGKADAQTSRHNFKFNVMNYFNPQWSYGYEVAEELEMYEFEDGFEDDSLSQVDCIEPINETESVLQDTFKNKRK